MLLVPSSRKSQLPHQSVVPPSDSILRSSIVGRPRHQGVMVGMGQKDSYVGYVPVDIRRALNPFLTMCCVSCAVTRHSRNVVS